MYKKAAQNKKKKKKVNYGALAGLFAALKGEANVMSATSKKRWWAKRTQNDPRIMGPVRSFVSGGEMAVPAAILASYLRQQLAGDDFSWKRLLIEPAAAQISATMLARLLTRKSKYGLAGFVHHLGNLYGSTVGVTELVRGLRRLSERLKSKAKERRP